MNDYTLTLLMPCLNEELTIETCIKQAKSSLEKSGLKGEILIADNGSTDRSIEIAQNCGARVVAVAERGYGAALIGGIEAADTDFIIMGDADGSYAWDDLGQMIDTLIAGSDLVMGNRFQGGIEDGAMPMLNRYLGNPVLSLLGRFLYRLNIGDFHCGLRGFRRDSIKRLHLSSPGMEFASEMVVKAGLAKLDIREVPTVLRKDGRDRPPHLRPFRDGWRHLRFLLTYSPRGLYKIPGSAFFVLGILGVLLELLNLNEFGNVILGPQSFLFFAVMIITGYNALVFSIVSEQHLSNSGVAPQSKLGERMTRTESLEIQVLVGGLLVIIGFIGALFAVGEWSKSGFGALDVMPALKLSIPSIISLVIGIQTMLMAFLIQVGKYSRK